MAFDNTNKRDVLIMADFPNIDKIKEIQKKYYDIADKIEPHIAVTFPFDSDISDEDLYEKLSKIAEKYKPFKITCRGVSTPAGEPNYRFLNVIENIDIIRSMSDEIYKSIIPGELEHRDKHNYVPHISYQIYSYVKNKDKEKTGDASGLLLYAKTDEFVTPDFAYSLGGNRISVKTLDLNADFESIANQLREIADPFCAA